MIDQGLRAKRSLAPAHRGRELFGAIALVVATSLGHRCGGAGRWQLRRCAAGAASAPTTPTRSGSTIPTVAAATASSSTRRLPGPLTPPPRAQWSARLAAGLRDLDGVELTDTEDCTIGLDTLRVGASGPSVTCLQAALASAGLYDGAPERRVRQRHLRRSRQAQEERDLFVDGVVGRETAISLGVWPDEESFVVRTPQPPPAPSI